MYNAYNFFHKTMKMLTSFSILLWFSKQQKLNWEKKGEKFNTRHIAIDLRRAYHPLQQHRPLIGNHSTYLSAGRFSEMGSRSRSGRASEIDLVQSIARSRSQDDLLYAGPVELSCTNSSVSRATIIESARACGITRISMTDRARICWANSIRILWTVIATAIQRQWNRRDCSRAMQQQIRDTPRVYRGNRS